jgi:hypothetical protein
MNKLLVTKILKMTVEGRKKEELASLEALAIHDKEVEFIDLTKKSEFKAYQYIQTPITPSKEQDTQTSYIGKSKVLNLIYSKNYELEGRLLVNNLM